MAYEKQIKCLGCGISIPDAPEDADDSELLCDSCLKKEHIHKIKEKIAQLISHGLSDQEILKYVEDYQEELIGIIRDAIENKEP